MHRPGTILVAGVGNALRADDGVGVHAVRLLQRDPIDRVEAVEIGTGILHGLSFLETADRVLVLDAVHGGHPPGTIYQFEVTSPREASTRSSIHAMGLIESARLLLPGKCLPLVSVIGVEPSTIDFGMELSEPVRAALPGLLALTRQTLANWLRQPLMRPEFGGQPRTEPLLCSAF